MKVKCIKNYGGNEIDSKELNFGRFHTDSKWCIELTLSFESCYTAGRDG